MTPGSRDKDNDRDAHNEDAGEERDGDDRDGDERDGDDEEGDDEENEEEEERKRKQRIRNGDEPADDIGYASLPDAVYDEEQSDSDDAEPVAAKPGAESSEKKAKNDQGTAKEPKIVHGEL